MSHAIHVRYREEKGKHIVTIEMSPPVPGIADDRWEYDTAEQAEQAVRSALKFARRLEAQGSVTHIEMHTGPAE